MVSNDSNIGMIECNYLRDVLKAINQAVREIVGGVYAPLCTSTVVRSLQGTVSDEIPHLRVPILEILLHAEYSLGWLVLSSSHSLELVKCL